jgi:hypothetical protein
MLEPDVVVRLLLSTDAADLAAVAEVCAPLVDKFGVADLTIERADPVGGRTGFILSLSWGESRVSGEPAEGALRRVLQPLVADFDSDWMSIDVSGDPDRGGFLDLDFLEFERDGFVYFSAMAKFGSTGIQESVDVVRDDFTVRQEEDLISRVHLQVPGVEPNEVLARCLPVAERMRASYVRIAPPEPGAQFCDVAALSALPVADNSAPERELRHAAERLAAQFGLDRQEFQFRDTLEGLTGVLEIEPREFEPGLHVSALYVRADVDPLCIDPLEDEG